MSIYSIDNIVPSVDNEAFIAHNATIIGNVTVEKNASVWFNAVIRADFDKISIGEDTNVQDFTMCHADIGRPLAIGKRVTVGHSCVIHGCTIGDDCLIGMGVVVMNGAVIGRGSIIAAGSVILENTVIPELSLVAGAPGKIKKTLDETAVSVMKASAEIYRTRSKGYMNPECFVKIR